jgi:DNA-binding SARP family transcriptional activator/tetratricopeptide (TPR) repeat protein
MDKPTAPNGANQLTIRISTLGTLQVVRNDHVVSEGDWHTRQARQLLKILITERPRPVATDRLIELLWPQSTPAAAATTLRSAINALRNVLEPERRSRAPSNYIITETPGYAFRPDLTLWLDVDIFEQKLNQVETSASMAERHRLLEEALALYQDDYLISDPYADWAQNERERLRERYFTALLRFAEIQADLGNLNAALAACRRILARDEVRENAYQALMRYQAEAGDSAGALLTYERCRTVLSEELGADPSPLTQRWHQRILNGEVQPRALEPLPASTTTILTSPQPSSPTNVATVREPTVLPQQTVLPVLDGYFADLFVGRQSEWAEATTRLQHALSGQGVLTLLAGEAGAGKTRFAYELLKLADAAGATVLSATCQPLERQLPFAPLADCLARYLQGLPDAVLASLPASSLAQVAQIVPSLADQLPGLPFAPHETPVRGDENRQRLVEGVVGLLAALANRRPLAFFIDDLHWADADTLAVLSRLAARLDEMALCVLLAYRSDDLSENEALATLLHSLKRERRHGVLTVERLTTADVVQLVAAVTGAEGQTVATLAAELHHTTGGNALFVTEALRDWQERSQAPARGNGDQSSPQPPLLRPSQRVQEIVTERMERLGEPARRLLQLSAVIARDFSLDLLEKAALDDPMSALEILLRRQFLVERPDERLEFSHQVVRQVAYEAMPTLQRRRLHRQVADALVALGRGHDSPEEVAYHYGRAGTASQAIFAEYMVRAGEKSLLAYGFQSAVAYFDGALAVLEKPSSTKTEWVGRALQGRGLAYESLFDPAGVTDTYRRLHSWAQHEGDVQLMLTAYSRLASMLGLLGQQGESNELLRVLMNSLANEGGGAVRSQVISDLYERRRLIYSADPPEATTWSGYTLPPSAVADPLGDILRTLDRVHAVLPLLDYGWTLLVQGQLTAATHCLETVVDLANETGQASLAATAYYQLAVAARILGHWEQSHALNERSILLNRAIQGVAAERASLWPRIGSAFLSLKQERIDEAERRLQRALALIDQSPDFHNHRNSAQIGLGLVALQRNKLPAAQRLLEAALADAVNLYPYTHVQALLGLARLAHLRQDAEGAAALLRQALRFAGQRSLLEEYIDTLLVVAELQPAGAPIERLLETMLRQVQAMGLDGAGAELSAALARFPA